MQNPIQTIWRFQIFQVFFRKINFFYCFDPYTAQLRKMKSAKNKHLLSYGEKTISDHFGNSNFFQNLKKNLNFSQYFSHDKCVEYVEIM